jgi:hypothetical protein
MMGRLPPLESRFIASAGKIKSLLVGARVRQFVAFSRKAFSRRARSDRWQGARPDVSGAILWLDLFLLSHFSGERPCPLEAMPQQDCSLSIALSACPGKENLVACRSTDARAKGLRVSSGAEKATESR